MTTKRVLSLLLAALLLVSLMPQITPKTDASEVYFGIDVSENNGYINWASVANNVDFAIVRCGYGMDQADQDDSDWYTNANACVQYGIPFGTYIYSYATTTARAKSEAEHVLRLVEGYDMDLPIFYDLEDSSVSSSCSAYEIYQIAKTFCDTITAAGYQVGIYANLNWWNNYLYYSEYDQWYRWVAQYDSSCDYQGDYCMWQYGESGYVSGVSGNVDVNYWYGSFPGSSGPKEHVCNYDTFVFFEAEHPHYSCYACSVCGNVIRDEFETNEYDQCFICNTPSQPSLLNMAAAYAPDTEIEFTWDGTTHTSHNNLWIDQKDASGEYVSYERISYAENGLTRVLPTGEYRVQLQSYNFNFWENDTCPRTFSDWYYFTVSENYECLLNGHQVQSVRTEPTCTQEGKVVETCARCGELISEAVLPATGHSFGEWTVTLVPTCLTAGLQEHTCTVCGEKEEAVVPAAGHSFDEWTLTQEPTCLHDGLQERVCTACGETEEAVVPAYASPAETFTDVSADAWYVEAVGYMIHHNLMNGVSATSFNPDGTITRAQFVTILYRAAGSPAVSGTSKFSDVPAGQWYTAPVIWASQNGIVNGVSATSFAPDASVTREQIATFLYRYVKPSTVSEDVLAAYADGASVSSYAVQPMRWAVSEGIISSSNGMLLPQNVATRAQVCAIFMNLLTND